MNFFIQKDYFSSMENSGLDKETLDALPIPDYKSQNMEEDLKRVPSNPSVMIMNSSKMREPISPNETILRGQRSCRAVQRSNTVSALMLPIQCFV
ncbi:hypothetical protein SUGI_0423370 [Cryptomeria japonica]|nr:hypothetical protein SUGI_0423370 [Cryptomeria japonica]